MKTKGGENMTVNTSYEKLPHGYQIVQRIQLSTGTIKVMRGQIVNTEEQAKARVQQIVICGK